MLKNFHGWCDHDKNWTNEILLTMNKKVMFLFIGDQGMKIFYQEQISHENIQRWIFYKLW